VVDVHYGYVEPYRSLGPGQPARPSLPVRVVHDARGFDTLCLVDSGADLTMFHADFAHLLGLDLETGQAAAVGGVVGSSTARLFTLDVLAGGRRCQDLLAFGDQLPLAGAAGGAPGGAWAAQCRGSGPRHA